MLQRVRRTHREGPCIIQKTSFQSAGVAGWRCRVCQETQGCLWPIYQEWVSANCATHTTISTRKRSIQVRHGMRTSPRRSICQCRSTPSRGVYVSELLLRLIHKTAPPTPFNQDYFKTLWTRYKAQSEQTLYSFRHKGAIDVFKRTGSLTVLQRAMGHASLAVSLGYLRNLEVPMLRVADMPKFGL